VQPVTTGPTGGAFTILIYESVPSEITEPSGNALGRQTALGQTVTFFNQNPKVAKQSRYTVGIQRELWGGWFMEATYLGDKGSDIEIVRNLNAVPNRVLNLDNSRTVAQQVNTANLSGTVRNPFCNTVSGNT
jgi:hypothetical protein